MKTIKNKLKQHKSKLSVDLFRNEKGAIDLASIMVGVIVIGLIGGVIAATVFTVIPWSQDNAAKQQLDSIASAESAYMGLSSANPSSLPAGYVANSFGNSSQLATGNLLQTGDSYCAVTPADGKSYTGYSKSASGKVWFMTDKNTKPAILTDPVPAECGFTNTGITTPIPDSTPTPPPYVDPTPLLTSLTLRCDVATTSSLFMQGSLTGTEKWNDRAATTYTNAAKNTSRTLNAGVTYTVTFTGTYTTFTRETAAMSACLRSVDHWGKDTGVTNASLAFSLAANLTDVPESIPSTINNMNQMFTGASKINDPDIGKWDVSKVTNMTNMFNGATVFNQPLNGWNVSNVTTLAATFYGATAFNQPLDKWDTSKVTNMSQTFTQASNFNQPLNTWKTDNVTNMYAMFHSASKFDQPLNTWNTSKVTDMGGLFNGAAKFDQPLNTWDTSQVASMATMFYGATAFNQPLNNWNTSKVQNMRYMFKNASIFNQNIKMWNVSAVTGSEEFRVGSALTAANSPF